MRATFHLSLEIANHRLEYDLHSQVHEGDHNIVFLTAARATRRSVTLVATTASLKTTWGEGEVALPVELAGARDYPIQ